MGANIGVTSIPFINSGWVERSLAIEADRANFELLNENIVLNGLSDKIQTLNYAVTDSPCMLEMEISPTNYGDHRIKKISSEGLYSEDSREIVQVRGDTLVNLINKASMEFEGKSIIVWIDIQCHEGYCFKGSQDWFINSKAIVVSEVWPYDIYRSGMEQKEFLNIAESTWSNFCVRRRGRFIKYPISYFKYFFEELKGNEHDNVIFIP